MRLLIVSNRLPVTVVNTNGRLEFKESVGGLVTGLSAYLDSLKGSAITKTEYVWVGWPGLAVDEGQRDDLKERLFTQLRAWPVFLPAEAMENFYHGFCNKTIWPLFHSFPSYVEYSEEHWTHYRQINEAFCNAVMEIMRPGEDVVWVHDYHLLLLPKCLRDRLPDAAVGFFLHIPFPPFEIFRLLPRAWEAEILEGLLGADLIGFHTYEYTRNFLRCVLRILGYEHDLSHLIVHERVAKADTFPMGIDFPRFQAVADSPKVQQERRELKKTLDKLKVVLSVDRLDYTKGIANRLRGYDLFLENCPQWRKRVTLAMVVVPSRIGVEKYQEMQRQIDELVGHINGKYGDIDWTPILYQYKYMPFQPLAALYSVSDVALITPLIDGMNLIAKEYLAVRTDMTGVLILSEMAGAAAELGEAVVINPNSVQDIAAALKTALEMPEEEQIRRNRVMRARLERYDVTRWAGDFMQVLDSVKKEQQKLDARLLDDNEAEQIVRDFSRARRRLLILDYDGTLVPFAARPESAQPSPELLAQIGAILNDKRNHIVLVSGRDKDTLGKWFGLLPVDLVGEHGVWIKEAAEVEWRMLKPLNNSWKSEIIPLLETYTDRLPGSFVEEKDFCVAWHYRLADPEFAALRVRELVDNLILFTANLDVQVLQGNKVVEVRNSGVNKGTAAMYFMLKNEYDFVLAAGDDNTDEDVFKVLSPKAYSIRVGLTPSYAGFNLRNYTEVLQLLGEFARWL